MKSLKRHLTPVILTTIFVLFVYWVTVVTISSEQMAKGNDYGTKGLVHKVIEINTYLNTGVLDNSTSNNFYSMRDKWYEKSEKTIKLIPYFLRP